MCLGEARGRGKKTVDDGGCGVPLSKKKLYNTTSPRGYRSHILSTFVSDSAPYPEFLAVLVAFILRGALCNYLSFFYRTIWLLWIVGAEPRAKRRIVWRIDSQLSASTARAVRVAE
jgi:hypothetical protein